MFTLTYVLPPKDGAKYGKATVHTELTTRESAVNIVASVLPDVVTADVRRFFQRQLWQVSWGDLVTHEDSGIQFMISNAGSEPNACPCCGRLVKFGDHAFAGSEDAYCLGCYTWGDSSQVPCDPEYTAHHNPWSMTAGADVRWALEATIDRGDETDFDTRYSTDAELHIEDPTDAALIAWPGLKRAQIIEATLTELD